MPKRSDQRRDKQLLLRLTADQMRVLEAAAVLEHESPNTHAYKALSYWLARLHSYPPLQQVLAAMEAHEAAAAAAPASISDAWDRRLAAATGATSSGTDDLQQGAPGET
jgi:hypothetical protein